MNSETLGPYLPQVLAIGLAALLLWRGASVVSLLTGVGRPDGRIPSHVPAEFWIVRSAVAFARDLFWFSAGVIASAYAPESDARSPSARRLKSHHTHGDGRWPTPLNCANG
jgi:hypothetical protein